MLWSVLHAGTVVLSSRMQLLLFRALHVQQKNGNTWDYCRAEHCPECLSTVLKPRACKKSRRSTQRSLLQPEPVNQFTFFPSNSVHDKSLKEPKITLNLLSRGRYFWPNSVFAAKNIMVIQTCQRLLQEDNKPWQMLSVSPLSPWASLPTKEREQEGKRDLQVGKSLKMLY